MSLSEVDRIHTEFTELLGVLSALGEISLQAAADDNFRKVLLLSAASYFEHQLTAIVAAYIDEVSGSNSLVRGLVQSKAIDRQYHTWFSWDDKNANRFYGMFGNDFKAHMVAAIKVSPKLDECVRAFLEMGQERNRLVHQNFAVFTMEKTAGEIYELYKKAFFFLDIVKDELRACTKNLKAAPKSANEHG